MQAAVDAAHAAQGATEAATDAEPATEPLPRLQAAVAAQESPAPAPSNGVAKRADARSSRPGRPATASQPADIKAFEEPPKPRPAVGPKLTAAQADGVALDDASKNGTRSAAPVAEPEPPAGTAASGWDAFRHDVGSGARVKHERAGWRDHVVVRRGGSIRGMALAGVAIAAVLIAATVVALTLTSRNSGGNPASGGGRKAKTPAAREAENVASAATWVSQQVSRTAVVACDPAMCNALASHGFPEAQLRKLGQNASYPVTSTLVVMTPVVQHELGTSLATNWAPAVLASFGGGANLITIRVMAPRGAAAYELASRADTAQRKALGAGLVTSRQISTTPSARSAMAAGDVDARLLIVITALASQHPIDILAFGRMWPGTSPGVPLRTADLAEDDPAAGMTEAAYLQAIIAELRGQAAADRPVHIATVLLAGKKALQIEFPAPSPLGLISPSQ